MKPQVTKESLAQWIAELESQPHLSLREERYLAVMKYAEAVEARESHLSMEMLQLAGMVNKLTAKLDKLERKDI